MNDPDVYRGQRLTGNKGSGMDVTSCRFQSCSSEHVKEKQRRFGCEVGSSFTFLLGVLVTDGFFLEEEGVREPAAPRLLFFATTSSSLSSSSPSSSSSLLLWSSFLEGTNSSPCSPSESVSRWFSSRFLMKKNYERTMNLLFIFRNSWYTKIDKNHDNNNTSHLYASL